MLSAPSQVLVRNQEHFAQGKWLIVNPTDSAIFAELPNSEFVGLHQYFDIYQQCIAKDDKNEHLFGASWDLNNDFDGAIIYMPKSKEHAAMLIANMAACVKQQGTLFLVGENKSGIKSAPKLFDKVSIQSYKIDSARHCALYCGAVGNPTSFNIDDWVQYKELNMQKSVVSIAFLPGVFSSGELDAGTKLLVDNIQPKLTGKVLDFACGAGIIACAVASEHSDVELTLCDVNALALYCARLSLKKNNLKGDVIASNGLAEIGGKFNHIFTNPPFHTGIKTDYSVTEEFIGEVKSRMLPNASLTLVANRFLPYPDILKASLGRVKTIAQTTKFNLYQS